MILVVIRERSRRARRRIHWRALRVLRLGQGDPTNEPREAHRPTQSRCSIVSRTEAGSSVYVSRSMSAKRGFSPHWSMVVPVPPWTNGVVMTVSSRQCHNQVVWRGPRSYRRQSRQRDRRDTLSRTFARTILQPHSWPGGARPRSAQHARARIGRWPNQYQNCVVAVGAHGALTLSTVDSQEVFAESGATDCDGYTAWFVLRTVELS